MQGLRFFRERERESIDSGEERVKCARLDIN